MASWYIGVNRGSFEQPYNVTAGTTTGGTDFEMRIDSGKSSTREDVVKAMRVLEQFILSNGAGAGENLPPK